MSVLSERLTECRKKLGFTKADAAKRIGISQPAYLRYEAEDRIPSVQMLLEIARVFHTSVKYLTGETDHPEPDYIEVRRAENEELYLIVERVTNLNTSQLRRLSGYLDKLTDTASEASS